MKLSSRLPFSKFGFPEKLSLVLQKPFSPPQPFCLFVSSIQSLFLLPISKDLHLNLFNKRGILGACCEDLHAKLRHLCFIQWAKGTHQGRQARDSCIDVKQKMDRRKRGRSHPGKRWYSLKAIRRQWEWTGGRAPRGTANVISMGKDWSRTQVLVLVLGNTVREASLCLNLSRTVGHPECYREYNWLQWGRWIWESVLNQYLKWTWKYFFVRYSQAASQRMPSHPPPAPSLPSAVSRFWGSLILGPAPPCSDSTARVLWEPFAALLLLRTFSRLPWPLQTSGKFCQREALSEGWRVGRGG